MLRNLQRRAGGRNAWGYLGTSAVAGKTIDRVRKSTAFSRMNSASLSDGYEALSSTER